MHKDKIFGNLVNQVNLAKIRMLKLINNPTTLKDTTGRLKLKKLFTLHTSFTAKLSSAATH